MLSAALLLVLVAAPPAAQETELQRNTTLPIDRKLGQTLDEYDAACAAGRWDRAAALLQSVLEADPGLLAPAGDQALLAGGAAAARARLAVAPAEVRSARAALLDGRAAAALAAALAPPDEAALLDVAGRFAGLAAGERARAALAELWEDRGQPELAEAWRPRPAAERAPRAPSQPESAARLPAVSGPDDPSLPVLDASALRPAWLHQFRNPPLMSGYVRHRVAIADGVVYASDGVELLAIQAGSGAILWRHGGDPRWSEATYRESSEMSEASSPHLLSTPVVAEGVVLCVLHEAEPLGRVDTYHRIDIRRRLPARRLHAFDPADGTPLWSAAVPWDDDPAKEPRGIACGSPAVAAGRIYLPVYDAVGTIDFSLECLDLRTGRLLWRRFLASGQLETNLFGNVLMELAVPPPLADVRRVLVCSQLGSYHALDAQTGEVAWTRLYARLRVEPTESGRVARRPQLLLNGFGVADGTRVAWAPVDGERVELLDAESGVLLAAWPAVDENYHQIVLLLGMAADRVWASGSRAFALPFDGGGPDFSQSGDARRRELAPGRAGAAVRGELLVPDGPRSVERFDAESLAHLGRALEFGDFGASGALQAAPGLLIVARPDGVAAYSHFPSLLAALQDPAVAAAQLSAVLPIARGLDLDADPSLAESFAAAASELAGRPAFAAWREDLLGLAARNWIAARQLDRAERLLAPWLDERPERAIEACGMILDEPLVAAAGEPLVERAARIVAASGAARLTLRNHADEPVAAVLARAAALRAIERGDSAAAREALSQLLAMDGVGGLAVRGNPVHDWADALLDKVLRQPAQAAAFEQEAERALAGQPLDARLLRAFGRSDAGQERLVRECAREDLDWPERLERARWRRDWGDPRRDWPDPLGGSLAPEPLPPLPRALEPGPRRSAAGALLAWRPAGAGDLRAFLPLYSQNAVVSVLFARDRAYEESLYPLGDRGNRTTTMLTGSFATRSGCAVLLQDALLHFGADGAFRRMPNDLNYLDYDLLLPLGGGLAAAVFGSREGYVRLRVFDGETGFALLDEDLPGSSGRRIELRADGRWLFVLEQGSERAYRVDLDFDEPPLAFGLPMPMSPTDLRSAVAMDGGVAYLANLSGEAAFAVRAIPGEAPWVRAYERAELVPLKAGPGLAWTAQALAAEAAQDEPRRIHWLAPGAAQEWSRDLGAGEVRFAELEFPHPQDPRGPDAIAFAPDASGTVVVAAHRLGAAEPLWRVRLDDVPYDSLRALQPQPRRAADGWVVCVLQSRTNESAARIHVLTVDDSGRVLGAAALPASIASITDYWAEPTSAGVLVRNGDSYQLFGDFPR